MTEDTEGNFNFSIKIFQIVIYIVGSALLIYSIYSTARIFISINPSRPDDFEKAFIVGKSKKTDIQIWKEKGGFEIDQVWRDYEASKVEYAHDKSGILSELVIKLDKRGAEYKKIKSASFANIKKDMEADCGKKWTQDPNEERIYRSKEGRYHCKFEDQGSEIFLTISQTGVY